MIISNISPTKFVYYFGVKCDLIIYIVLHGTLNNINALLTKCPEKNIVLPLL